LTDPKLSGEMRRKAALCRTSPDYQVLDDVLDEWADEVQQLEEFKAEAVAALGGYEQETQRLKAIIAKLKEGE